MLKKEGLQDRYVDLAQKLDSYRKETQRNLEGISDQRQMNHINALNKALKELHPVIMQLKPEQQKTFTHVYEILTPLEFTLHAAVNDINRNAFRLRNELLKKQTRAHRLLGWTLLAIALCSLLLLRISHGNIKNVALLLETSKSKSKRLKEAINQAQKANRSKSDFLATMSHEIRTPLNAVIGFTSLLLDTKLSYDQKDYIQSIRASSNSLLFLLNDILDVSKIEAGKMVLEFIEFDLRTIYSEVVNIVADNFAQKKLELLSYIDPQIPQTIKGDPGRIKQIILNLLNNALKFTPSGCVTFNATMISMSENKIVIDFIIKDTGIGIDPRHLNRLFTPFSQADSSTTRRYGGTGLGLSICNQLALLMGGEIGVSSTPGKGSLFKVRIQLDTTTTTRHENPLPKTFKDKKVLVLARNSLLQEFLNLQLQDLGLIALIPSPQDLENYTPPKETIAIILDLNQLPFNPDLEFHFLKKFSRNAEIPIIYLIERTHNIAHLLPTQRINYLKKPILQQNIQKCLLEVLHVVNTLVDEPSESPFTLPNRHTLNKPRILLVEDNPINQKIALLMLEKINCNVDVAANGIEALKALQLFTYDLIFMDCQMPEMDGYEATRRIRKMSKPISDIPVVAFTANAFIEDHLKCIEAGMNDFVTKPVELSTLDAKIKLYVKTASIFPRSTDPSPDL
ncbi:MAG: response regulator [Bdellovibrionaceae bacterium]|nr:response regulator [Pseudobdellovibrionaceae bacterium]